MSKALCNLPVAILALAGVVAAKWSLGKQLEVSKPAHPYIFFSAKTAVTFIQLSDDLLNGPHPHIISFSVRRSVSDYRHSSYFLAGSILRTGRAENGMGENSPWTSGAGSSVECGRPGPVPVRTTIMPLNA